jgi:hypothetical protein
MADSKTQMTGRWCSLFGSPMSFAQEIKAAKEIEAIVSLFGTQVNVEVAQLLPGWVTPLWGSDDRWLYLRRPEGIWKVRLPVEHAGARINIYLKDPNHEIRVSGTFIGTDWVNVGGWMLRQCEPSSPEQLDANASPSKAPGYDVDEIGIPLLNRILTDDGRNLFHAGDAFASVPELWVDRKAVIGKDKASGRRVAFGINGTEAQEVLESGGVLWLRFSGEMLLPVEAKVSAQ